MIQNNVEKFRPIHGLSFTQQSNFDMLNNFLRNQSKKAASVTDFSSTSVKDGLFEKINPHFFLEIESMIAKTNFTLGPIEKSIFLVQL